MTIGYAVAYGNRRKIDPTIGATREDANAILRVLQLQYPHLAESAEIVELVSPVEEVTA